MASKKSVPLTAQTATTPRSDLISPLPPGCSYSLTVAMKYELVRFCAGPMGSAIERGRDQSLVRMRAKRCCPVSGPVKEVVRLKSKTGPTGPVASAMAL